MGQTIFQRHRETCTCWLILTAPHVVELWTRIVGCNLLPLCDDTIHFGAAQTLAPAWKVNVSLLTPAELRSFAAEVADALGMTIKEILADISANGIHVPQQAGYLMQGTWMGGNAGKAVVSQSFSFRPGELLARLQPSLN